jgi:hypothetical protein
MEVRLWTLHPKYLDAKGLVALWREALLARAVLRGRTRGYKHHPQLERIRAHPRPVSCINAYLHAVRDEAELRGYEFDRSRIGPRVGVESIIEQTGQMQYEWAHLLQKLKRRSPDHFRSVMHVRRPRAHPLFALRPGGVQSWERPASVQ